MSHVAFEEKPPAIFGQFGLVRLAVVGGTRGVVTGKVTCYKYAVNPGRVMWVDKREKAQLLTLRDQDGGPIFAETDVQSTEVQTLQ